MTSNQSPPPIFDWPEARPISRGDTGHAETQRIPAAPSAWADPQGESRAIRDHLEDSLGDRYDIHGEIGRGGMAIVYGATERSTRRRIALKVVRNDLLRDAETRARFDREATLTSALRHPHIVATYGVHESPRGIVLALEYVDGGTLKNRVRREGALPIHECLRILTEIGQALQYAHGQGVVHRDLKPDNVFLEQRTGLVKLGDFGIARAADSDTLTLKGAAIGTPAYMSPEQIDGEQVDVRSDLYSLALLGWEMLTGEQPWAGETLFSIIHKQKTESLPSIREQRPEVSASFATLLETSLAKSPDKRPASAAAFLQHLLVVEAEARVLTSARDETEMVSRHELDQTVSRILARLAAVEGERDRLAAEMSEWRFRSEIPDTVITLPASRQDTPPAERSNASSGAADAKQPNWWIVLTAIVVPFLGLFVSIVLGNDRIGLLALASLAASVVVLIVLILRNQ